MKTAGDSQSSAGFALITVLLVCMILSVIMIGVLRSNRTEASIVHNRTKMNQMSALADGAITLTIARLLAPGRSTLPSRDGSPFPLSVGGQEIRLTLQDEAGMIDLNTAGEALLRGLLRSAKLDEFAAQALADKILDWREPGSAKRLNGAKIDDYRLAGYGYGPRGGPFESVGELKLVMGMTPDLFERLAPALTVNSQQPQVDPAVAPADVLRALPGMTEDTVASVLDARSQGRKTGGAPPFSTIVRSGGVYTITAEMEDGGMHVKRLATVRLSGSGKAPVWVYDWQ